MQLTDMQLPEKKDLIEYDVRWIYTNTIVQIHSHDHGLVLPFPKGVETFFLSLSLSSCHSSLQEDYKVVRAKMLFLFFFFFIFW